ncbi:hypothetical protein SORBI_3002G126100 [Sorghum bicolor]|uniref:RBR-type E3 ubiquitin transferase n=1 Tax=Sorghum bicolor TaxID=4558 RepID=C5X561_SORBI|nr:hypothetical protein SORBI_3002G126100 [Sorghum bicolor]
MIDQVMSLRRQFDRCEITLVEHSQVSYVFKSARDYIDAQIAKALAERSKRCNICLEDTEVSKIHAVEGCAHRFCLSCMKEHVRTKLLHGTLPSCPQDGCTSKLTVEDSKVFLSPQLLEIMVQRIGEEQIPPTQKIYCPYPKCSALMSLSELMKPMQGTCSKYTVADVVTLRKCRYEFCYTCGSEWKEKKATCTCPLWEEHNIIRHDNEEEDEDYYDEEDAYYGRGPLHDVVHLPFPRAVR